MKKIILSGILFLFSLLAGFSQAPDSFMHPGVFSGQAELDALKVAVATNNGSPAIDGYNELASENLGDPGYLPTPYADVYVIGSGSCPEERAFRQDAHAFYIQALKWVVTGNNAHRDKAIQIADAWAKTFKRIIPETNKPNQSTLEASWALPIWVAGAEILKYYNDGISGWSSAEFDSFVRNVLVYVNGNIYQTANWLISKDLSLMAAGVFLNDKELYNEGYHHVTGQIDDITVSGEIPELNRDFVHSQYVLIGLTQCAEIAWQQGDQGLFLWSDARLRTGAEAYVQCVVGAIQPNYFSSSDWARNSAPYEILLTRYTELGMSVPNVQNYVVSFNRTENGSEDHFVGWLSATHAISVSGLIPEEEIPGNVAYDKTITATSEPQAENPATSANDNNRYTRWSASGYPQSIEVDLGSGQRIHKTEVICYDNRAYQFIIEARKNLTDNFEVLVDRSSNITPGSNAEPIVNEFSPVETRYVRMTITGASGYDGSWVSINEFRIYSSDDAATGFEEQELKSKVFPNPANQMLHFNSQSLIRSITLLDIKGVRLRTENSVNALVADLNIADFSPGTYLYHISDYTGRTKSGQVIIK